jgi:LysM domain
MMPIETISPRASVRVRPVQVRPASRGGRPGSRGPQPSRPVAAPPRYRGTGVLMSTVSHRPRPITPATTVALALVAAGITVWLGFVAHFGGMLHAGPEKAAVQMPDRLAVVRVEPGETLQHLAARVAPDAPTGQVTARIRELNELTSSAVTAGQTLIAPVG